MDKEKNAKQAQPDTEGQAQSATTTATEAAAKPQAATQSPSKRREVKDQRTIVRKRDKALLMAMGVFALVMAGVALLGILLVHPPREYTQGQVDCEQVRVSGKLPGRIVKFYVEEGQYVHKGDTLVAISCKTADASLNRAKSMKRAAEAAQQRVDRGSRNEVIESARRVVEQAEAAQGIAQKTYDRMENLYQEGVVTAQKRDEAKAALDVAIAAVRTAQSNLALTENGSTTEDKAASQSMTEAADATVQEVEALLDDQVLVAPCDGEVSEIYPHVGELVSMGTPIMSISQLDNMWVSFSVREEKLNEMPMGAALKVKIPALGDKKTTMRVYYVHDMGSYAVWNATKAYGQYDSKTFEVKVSPTEYIKGLRPGMSVLIDEPKR